MSYRQLSILIVLCNVKVWIELHKLLIVEFSPSVHKVSSLAYCQEQHLVFLGYVWGKCYVFLRI